MNTMEPEREHIAPVATGDPRVDAAVEQLASIDELDLADRPAVLEDVHDRLREVLGELGDAPSGEPARPGEPGRRGDQHMLPPGPLSGNTAPRR
jgi:hypothetical protein